MAGVTRRFPLALLLGLLAVLVLLGSAPASAASYSTKVTLSGSAGPTPAAVTIAAGDGVTFDNQDTLDHEIKVTGPAAFTLPVPAHQKRLSPVFGKAGTYSYTDSRLTPVVLPGSPGKITVTAAPAASGSPAPAPAGSSAPAPSTSAQPAPSASAAPGSSPAPAAAPPPAGGSGTAIPPLLPGFLGGTLPTAGPGPLTGPAPDVAPPAPDATAVAGASPGATAGAAGSTDSGSHSGGGTLAQRSPGRHYGLPGALAVVAIVGLLTLLARVVLAEPAARRRDLPAGAGAAATVD